jgi:hypothetical protein
MALGVVLRHQNAAKVRVVHEFHTKQVVDLPLEPIRGVPKLNHAVDGETVERDLTLDSQCPLVPHGPQLVHDLYRLATPVVDGCHVNEQIIALLRVVPQPLQNLSVTGGIHEDDMLIAGLDFMVEDGFAEAVLKCRHRRVHRGITLVASRRSRITLRGLWALLDRVERGAAFIHHAGPSWWLANLGN